MKIIIDTHQNTINPLQVMSWRNWVNPRQTNYGAIQYKFPTGDKHSLIDNLNKGIDLERLESIYIDLQSFLTDNDRTQFDVNDYIEKGTEN